MHFVKVGGWGQQGCGDCGHGGWGGARAGGRMVGMSSRCGEGLVIGAVPFGERDALVRVLCAERGLLAGLVKGGKGKAAMVQPFNTVGYDHYRRLEGQLGTLTLDLRVSRAARWLGQVRGGYVAAYLSELLAAVLPEEHPYEGLSERVVALVDGGALWREVVAFEMFVLEVVGYGLRLGDTVRGNEERGSEERGGEVVWVSPSSGRSVTRAAAAGWEAKLLALPACMGGPACSEMEDFMRAWRLTGCFLDKALHGKKLAARARLADHYAKGLEVHDETLAA
ncbi:MAG: hypothetical protein GC129_02330 [Proteobacteria bacterium]|nr:hypothetical protein [Pseudomonadota bacterium]